MMAGLHLLTYLTGKQRVERMNAISEESLENFRISRTDSAMTSIPRAAKGSAPRRKRFPSPLASQRLTLFQKRARGMPLCWMASATTRALRRDWLSVSIGIPMKSRNPFAAMNDTGSPEANRPGKS